MILNHDGSVEYEVLEAAILDYAGANAALDELCRQGINRNEFLDLLAFTVYMRSPTDKRAPQSREIPGMPPRRLKKLADRMDGLADELQRVDSHPLISDMYEFLPPLGEEQFKPLPDILRARAYTLRLQVSLSRSTYSTIHREMEKRGKLNLIEYVRKSSIKQRPMYRALALLLTAGFCALGFEEEITPESLRVLWHDDLRRSTMLKRLT